MLTQACTISISVIDLGFWLMMAGAIGGAIAAGLGWLSARQDRKLIEDVVRICTTYRTEKSAGADCELGE